MFNSPTLHAIAIVIRGTIVSCLVAALFGLISFGVASGFQQVWNAVLSERATLPPITYLQAAGIGLVLVVIWNVMAWRRSA